MNSSFRRSSRFGLIGVFVVAIAVAAIALTMGQGQADPKQAYILIFGVIGAFVVLLLVLQARDLTRAEGDSVRGAVGAPHDVADPTKLTEPELWASLAIKPVDDDAVKARQEAWGAARSSMRLAWLIVPLIFIGVVPMYVLGTFVPLMICVPLIVLIALYGAFRALGPGGHLQHGYELTDRSMAPLGLQVSEKWIVRLQPRWIQPGWQTRLDGALGLSGKRHGRKVSVRFESGVGRPLSEVAVGVSTPEFDIKAKDGKLKPDDKAPPEVVELLQALGSSTRWRSVHAECGPEGILVLRKGNSVSEWLCDLWLAKHLADAVRSA